MKNKIKKIIAKHSEQIGVGNYDKAVNEIFDLAYKFVEQNLEEFVKDMLKNAVATKKQKGSTLYFIKLLQRNKLEPNKNQKSV